MGQEMSAKPSPTAAIVGIVGAVLAIIGSFLVWAKVSADFGSLGQGSVSVTVKGTEGDGKITLVLGILLLITGVVLAVAKTRGLARGMAILAIVFGVLVVAIGAYDVANIKSKSVPAGAGIPQELLDLIKISIGPGLWVVILGGVLGLVGGVMGIGSAKRLSGGGAMPAAPDMGGTTAGGTPPPSMPPPSMPPPSEPPVPPSGGPPTTG